MFRNRKGIFLPGFEPAIMKIFQTFSTTTKQYPKSENKNALHIQPEFERSNITLIHSMFSKQKTKYLKMQFKSQFYAIKKWMGFFSNLAN